MKKLKPLLLSLLFLIACQSEPREVLTSENAKTDAIQLLNDLQMKYNGIHCTQPAESMWDRHEYVICTASTKDEFAKINCQLHNCTLVEKKALRIKFGIIK